MNYIKKYKKYSKKLGVTKKLQKAVGKTRYNNYSKGGAQLYKDVMMLKKLVNVEKKRFDITIQSAVIGQIAINTNGFYALDITPIPVQGVAYNQRTGSSCKITSAFHEFQFWGQTNNTHPQRVSIEYFQIKGATQVVNTFVGDYFSLNPCNGLIDYNSPKDPDYFGQAKLLMRKEFVFTPAFSSQVQIKDIKIPLRLQHHIRFDQNSTTIDDGQIIMVMRADSGNTSTLSTLTNVPILTASSATIFNGDLKWYYVDN